MKTFLKILAAIALVVVLLFVIGRYGWRVLGFAACDDPNANYAESVTEGPESLCINGGTGSSFSSYVGSVYQIADGKLYLGIKHNGFLGFFERLGGFAIEVPTAGQAVDSIYFKDGKTERLIWTRAEGLIRLTAQTPPAATEDGTAADSDIISAGYPFDAEDGEDDLCAVLFLGYDEASADAAVAKLCGEYEVIHGMFLAGDVELFDAHGAEQYLILPKFAGETLTVVKMQLDDDGYLQPAGEPVTTEKPLRIYCNYSDIVPSAGVTVRHGERSISFEPFISLEDGKIAPINGAYALMYGQE